MPWRASAAAMHVDHGGVQVNIAQGAEEPGVPEAEHSPVGAGQPVAATVRCRVDPHYRGVEVDTAEGAEEPGVTKGEHPTIRRHQPVPAAIGGGDQTDHGGVEVNAAQ